MTTDRPSSSAVAEFLQLVNDPAKQPVYVHCQGGRHRTGVMTAVYRMTQDGWTADRAYDEMKQFNFEGFPGHPALKSFVYDFSTQADRSRMASNTPVGSNSPAAVAEVTSQSSTAAVSTNRSSRLCRNEVTSNAARGMPVRAGMPSSRLQDRGFQRGVAQVFRPALNPALPRWRNASSRDDRDAIANSRAAASLQLAVKSCDTCSAWSRATRGKRDLPRRSTHC